jgi:hypothetical protein
MLGAFILIIEAKDYHGNYVLVLNANWALNEMLPRR